MTALRRVWRGEVPLPDLLWTWLLFGGLAVNVSTTIGLLALLSAGWPVAALLVGYGLALPYNVLVGVGCWRAAARNPAARVPVWLTRAAVTAVLIVLSAV